MLVLTRKWQESILVSDDVVITVLAIRGSTVKLGIEAPRQKRVLRTELTAEATRRPDCRPSSKGVPRA